MKDLIKKAKEEQELSYFDFSILMQNLLVSEGAYLFDSGSGVDANAEVALRLIKNIKKHPLLWKWFFMVA